MKQPPLIHIHKLCRHYGSGPHAVRALHDISLDIQAGEFVMIVGSSGSGKSTLMHLLGLLDQPSSGSLTILGTDASQLNDEALSGLRNRHIGFVFQQFNLLPELTVVENIALPLTYAGVERSESLRRAAEAAARLGLAERLSHRPTQLSGGQNQRVAIARALVSKPSIILADEPTGALDSHTGMEIMQILHDLNREGCTLIMVTHDHHLATTGSRRITMRDGSILADETLRPIASSLQPTQAGSTAAPAQVPAQHRAISLPELARTGLREGILPHKLRSFLTMLGIIIGVASVISMTSFSQGSKKKQADQIRALGSNLIKIVNAKADNERVQAERAAGSRGLSHADLAAILAGITGLGRHAASTQIQAPLAIHEQRINARLLAVDGDYLGINNLSLAQGRRFDAFDDAQAARVCILGAALARLQEASGSPVVGGTVSIAGSTYTIIGILKAQSVDLKGLEATGLRDANYDILIPHAAGIARFYAHPLRPDYDEIIVQTQSEESLLDTGRQIQRLLDASHAGIRDFSLVIPMDLLRQKEESARLLDLLTLIISSVSMLVGGIGIMNIMLAAVQERIREIGVRRATGASQRDILIQFLAEAAIISIGGGLLGLLAAFAIVGIVLFSLHIPIAVSPLLLAGALLCSCAIGLIFGIYPARNAARLNPVEALRNE